MTKKAKPRRRDVKPANVLREHLETSTELARARAEDAAADTAALGPLCECGHPESDHYLRRLGSRGTCLVRVPAGIGFCECNDFRKRIDGAACEKASSPKLDELAAKVGPENARAIAGAVAARNAFLAAFGPAPPAEDLDALAREIDKENDALEREQGEGL